MSEPLTLTTDCVDVPDSELGPMVKQPLITMAREQAEQAGLRLVDDPQWESFTDEAGKRYAIKLIWPTEPK